MNQKKVLLHCYTQNDNEFPDAIFDEPGRFSSAEYKNKTGNVYVTLTLRHIHEIIVAV
jgi:hypothetical protein